MPELVVAFLALALWAFCLFDAITSPRAGVRLLPKVVWVIAIVVGSLPGAVLWLLFGRPKREYVPVDVTRGRSSPARVLGPEDAPDFEERLQRGLRLQQEHPPDQGD